MVPVLLPKWREQSVPFYAGIASFPLRGSETSVRQITTFSGMYLAVQPCVQGGVSLQAEQPTKGNLGEAIGLKLSAWCLRQAGSLLQGNPVQGHAAVAVWSNTIKSRKKDVGGNGKINPIALQLFLFSEKEIQLGRTY